MTEFKETELDERAIKMAKVLSADAVEKAGSGHPGSPISLAPVAYTLYQHFIKHDPNDPNWEGRDRFILSGGDVYKRQIPGSPRPCSSTRRHMAVIARRIWLCCTCSV